MKGRTEHRQVALPNDRPLRVAIVADTHSKPHPKALGLVHAEQPDLILHGGDIGDLAVLDQLSTVAETIAVRGNIDPHDARTPDHVVIDFFAGDHTSGPALRVLLTHIAVAGPRLRKDARALAKKHKAQIVVCGHSHVPLIAKEGPVAVFNPGSIGPRRFHLPITFGVLGFEPGKPVKLRHVSCETGQEWRPSRAADLISGPL